MSEPWFEPSTFSAYFGSTVGVIGGVFGTVVGIVGGVLLPRGKGKAFIRAALVALLILGLALLAIGLCALADGQPYGIWYPLVLGGAIFSIVGGLQSMMLGRIFRVIDRRKMEADDLRRA